MPIQFHCDCGKPFWTADANAGRRMICTRCGRELGIPGLAAGPDQGEIVYLDPIPARTSVKAILSLSLGLASFACSYWLCIPGIVLGLIALRDVGRARGRLEGKGLAIAGIVIGSAIPLLFLASLMVPWNMRAHEAARRSQCINNLKQIGLALHNYHAVNDAFPPAAILDPRGKPLLSWRVAILPFIEQDELYRQFKLDEPWDSPNNLPLAAKVPNVYLCPSDRRPSEGTTCYQVIVGPGSLFDGDKPPRFEDVTDGTSRTLAVVEAKHPVPWTKPEDVDIRSIDTALGSDHRGGYNVLIADGSVKFIKLTISPKILQALATRAGGEVVVEESY